MENQLSAPLGSTTVHLCVDCQRLFAEETDWYLTWMPRVLPVVTRIAQAHPAATMYTRFIPVKSPQDARGTWRKYYERWPAMTLDRIGLEMVALVPDLAALVPPGEVVDKHVYSPWVESDLEARLRTRRADTLVVTGGEADVCVLATVLGAIDRGYRVVLATDALCSSSDAAHDASLNVYHQRFSQQVETAPSAAILAAWLGNERGR